MVERSLGVGEATGSIPVSPTVGVSSSWTGYSSIGRALGSGPRGSQFKPEYPETFVTSRFRALVRGRVQGVGFRWFVMQEADALGLSGWVRNLSDGSVEVEAEGENLEAFREVLRKGPPSADVVSVDFEDREPQGGAGFRVVQEH
jgi:acylphosphatase